MDHWKCLLPSTLLRFPCCSPQKEICAKKIAEFLACLFFFLFRKATHNGNFQQEHRFSFVFHSTVFALFLLPCLHGIHKPQLGFMERSKSVTIFVNLMGNNVEHEDKWRSQRCCSTGGCRWNPLRWNHQRRVRCRTWNIRLGGRPALGGCRDNRGHWKTNRSLTYLLGYPFY